MKATFLEAEVHLTKTFTLENGEIKKIGHPRILNYTSHEEEFNTIEELFTKLKAHADKGHCFLKGHVNRPLVNEPRAGSTEAHAPTRLILLDFDGIKGVDDVEEALTQLGLSGVDYIVQYSSSSGVLPERGLSAHVFMLLDKDTSPALLKQWLTHQNLTVPILKKNLALTRTNNSIRWPLDITTCQNDKLIYIAPPILGTGVKDGFTGDRIRLEKRKKPFLTLIGNPNAEANKLNTEEALNVLRSAAGLPERPKTTYKSAGQIEYLAKPDKAIVTGSKTERGFTYLNLNGGDSWGYYHPENNPEFIFNFKNEPVYKTSELVPEYWSEVKHKLTETRPDEKGQVFLAFRDFRTATYYNGIWLPKPQKLELAIAKGKEQLFDFMKQHGQPKADFIPDWKVEFDPHSEYIVDLEGKSVNTYQPSMYMSLKPNANRTIPPIIRKIIFHAIGQDEEAFERFMNWLAVIIQYKTRTGTAWVFHGIQGTGKGLILNYVLRPIFGQDYVVSKRMEELESQFNGYMERAFILFVDEVQLSESNRTSILEANLKTFISEPKMSIRKMHTLPYEVDNYINIIFASNMDDPVVIQPGDRRFNVGVYQDEPIDITSEEVEGIELELMDFYSYLMTRPADRDLARKPLNNAAKEKMANISRPAIDLACEAILAGDLTFFWNLLPTGSTEGLSRFDREAAERYEKLVLDLVRDEPETISRDEIHTLLDYTVGGMPVKPFKFTSLLKHHKVDIVAVSKGGKTVRGIKVKWKVDPEWKKR